jgi:hypothetical protein
VDTLAHLPGHDRPRSPISKGGETRRSRCSTPASGFALQPGPLRTPLPLRCARRPCQRQVGSEGTGRCCRSLQRNRTFLHRTKQAGCLRYLSCLPALSPQWICAMYLASRLPPYRVDIFHQNL